MSTKNFNPSIPAEHFNCAFFPYLSLQYSFSQDEYQKFQFVHTFSEYDALVRQGITDPKGFIKKKYRSEPLIYLRSCCVGQMIQDCLEANVEEALSSGTWIDVMVKKNLP